MTQNWNCCCNSLFPLEQYLNVNQNKWIIGPRPIEWPFSSLDLTPLDFILYDGQKSNFFQGNNLSTSPHSQDNYTVSSTNYNLIENCRFQYVLAAATSIATKQNEDTLTYLNQGQSYEVKLKKLGDLSMYRGKLLKVCLGLSKLVAWLKIWLDLRRWFGFVSTKGVSSTWKRSKWSRGKRPDLAIAFWKLTFHYRTELSILLNQAALWTSSVLCGIPPKKLGFISR